MSDAAIPWLLLGDSRRKTLAARIAGAVQAWRLDWLAESAGSVDVEVVEDVRARPTDIRAHEAWCFRAHVDNGASIVLVVPRRSLAMLVGAPVHGADAVTRMVDERSLAAALEREALIRLSRSLIPGEITGEVTLERLAQSAVDVFRQWDAARFVCTSIVMGGAHCALDVLIAPALVDMLTPVRPRAPEGECIERRRSAVAKQMVEVEGFLGAAEVPVSELAALSVGDVIVLQQSITDAAALALRHGEQIGVAVPGRVDGKRAIQMRGRAA